MAAPAHLDEHDADAIEKRVARIERRAGVQVVVSVVGKCDAYVELPWKAFAMGAALAGLALVVLDALRPGWITRDTVLVHVIVLLAAAGASALLAVFVPDYARLFLRRSRRDAETQAYARSVFLRRELFATPRRDAVLLMMSRFERSVTILPDRGLDETVAPREWDAVIARMLPTLAARRVAEALLQGLDGIEQVLLAKGHRPATSGNRFPDRPVDEDGQP
jgi:putative membrane protein